jgi:hypothetical protein
LDSHNAQCVIVLQRLRVLEPHPFSSIEEEPRDEQTPAVREALIKAPASPFRAPAVVAISWQHP